MKLSLKVVGSNSGNVDVVLIHGTGSSSEMWHGQVEVLSQSGYRCFLLDLRGHGESHEPEEPTDLQVHVDDVLETLHESGIEFPAAFIGHSLGSLISLNIAQNQPELADSLFLAALPARVYQPMAHAFRFFLKGPYHFMRGSGLHEKMAWRERTLFNTPLHSLNQIVENFDRVDLLADPVSVQCPIHLSAGLFDPVAPCQHIIKIHKSIPHSTLKVFEFAGHNFMDYNKHAFNEWILEKLKAKGSGSVDDLASHIHKNF